MGYFNIIHEITSLETIGHKRRPELLVILSCGMRYILYAIEHLSVHPSKTWTLTE